MPTDMEIAGIEVGGLAVIELADRLLHAGHMDTSISRPASCPRRLARREGGGAAPATSADRYGD